jgi:lipoate-protein ligase A
MRQDREASVEPTVNEDLLGSFEAGFGPVYRIYEPSEISVVMGAGRRHQNDLKPEPIAQDAVPVYLRKGGGGTVVLSPGMVVLAFVTSVSHRYFNRKYANRINGWIIRALDELGVTDVVPRGISDLAIDNRKILGASLFRRKYILFYQSSLLVSNDVALFSRYLTYPSTVPEYRNERAHEDFCTTLTAKGYELSVDDVIPVLEKHIAAELPGL